MQVEQLLPLVKYNVVMEEPILYHREQMISRLCLYNDYDQQMGSVMIDGSGKVYFAVFPLLDESLKFRREIGVFMDKQFFVDIAEKLGKDEKTATMADLILMRESQAEEISEAELLMMLPIYYEHDFYPDEEKDDLVNHFDIHMNDAFFTDLAKFAHAHDFTLDDALVELIYAGADVLGLIPENNQNEAEGDTGPQQTEVD